MTPPRVDWKNLRDQLWIRSKGLCEVSGIPLDYDTFDAHHRRPKGMGGDRRPDTNTLVNLLALDPQVHNGGPKSVHGNRPRSEVGGWLIPKRIDDAGSVPVMLHDGRIVQLATSIDIEDGYVEL